MTSTIEQQLRVAIVGAGPAGFYATGAVLDSGRSATVDLFDRLPTPFGLVRAGVAPDHPKIKSVTRVYEKTAAKPGFRFFGGVELGTDVQREDVLGEDDTGCVTGLRVVRNRIEPDDSGRLRAVPTGEEEVIECGLVLRSIGYRGRRLDDVPFDERRGLIRNDSGRVCGEDGEALPGEYVVGWIKRGPTGVIGTNKKDAADTVARIVE